MSKPSPTLIERAQTALMERCGVVPGATLVAACSGGADSVALVHALGALGHPLSVVFVDHGLRDVADEQAAARAAAVAVAAPFIVKELSGLGGRSNLQAHARAARYAALHGVADALGGLDIAVGHTRSDQAETVLGRLLRGSGPHGLAAMAWRNGRVVRPLLDVSRAETRAAGHPFADDPSNASDAYQRNRIRHHVMPLLVVENPGIERVLAELADQLAGQRDLIDRMLRSMPHDIELVGVELATIEAYLHAKAAQVGVHARAEPLAAWARALHHGAPTGSYPLGGEVVGQARAGRASFKRVIDPRGRVAAWGPGTYRRGLVRMEIVVAPIDADSPLDTCDTRFEPIAEADVVWPLVLEAVVDGSHVAGHRVVDGTGRLLRSGPEAATSPNSEGIDGRTGSTMAIYVGISIHPNGDVVAEHEGTLPLNG